MAVFAPMPSASAITAAAVKPGFFNSIRKPKRTSCQSVCMTPLGILKLFVLRLNGLLTKPYVSAEPVEEQVIVHLVRERIIRTIGLYRPLPMLRFGKHLDRVVPGAGFPQRPPDNGGALRARHILVPLALVYQRRDGDLLPCGHGVVPPAALIGDEVHESRAIGFIHLAH